MSYSIFLSAFIACNTLATFQEVPASHLHRCIVDMISGRIPHAHYSFSDNLGSCRRACSKPRYLSRALHSNRTWYGLSGPVWHIVHLACPMFCCMPLGCPPMSSAITLDTMGIKLGFLATNILQGWIFIPFTLSLYTKSSLYRRHDALHRTCSDFHTSLVILLICSTDSNWSLSINDSSISSSPYFFMVSHIMLTGLTRFLWRCAISDKFLQITEQYWSVHVIHW